MNDGNTKSPKDGRIFSVTRKDLVIQEFRAGGKGGQKQNKTNSGVRIKHPPSGAVGESRTHRSKEQNKKAALHRLAKSKKFLDWVKVQAAAIEEGYRNIEQKVEEMTKPENLEVEYFDPKEDEWIRSDGSRMETKCTDLPCSDSKNSQKK